MEKKTKITDIQWRYNKGMSLVEQLVYRPKYNPDTNDYELFFNKRFKGWRIWQVMALIWKSYK